MNVTVEIPKTQEAREDGKPFTFYMLKVTVDDVDEAAMVVPRRYSDFESLHRELVQDLPMIFDSRQSSSAPRLPGKRLFGNMEPAFVQERRQHLESFLQQIVRFDDVIEHPSAVRFLKIGI